MNKNPSNPYLRLFVIPLLLILTACSVFSGKKENPQATLTPATKSNPSVAVQDQASDGTSVVVKDVFSQGPGWMVIHNQVHGQIGDAIGETQLQSGDNKNVVVKIDPAQATPVMYAMLHEDAGTVGKYEFPGPDIPVMLNNQMVSPAFNATILTASANTPTPVADNMSMATPSAGSQHLLVKVSDQALAGDMITVDEVVSSAPGWIVIYTTNSYGQPDQPIGHAAVNAGVNQKVMLKVDPTKAQGTLYAQLHVDKGTIGTFEFPGADAPVMNGVQMIASTFKVIGGQSIVAAATPVPAVTPVSTATHSVTETPVSAGSSVLAATPAVLQPSITVSDQAVQNGTVTVAQVISNGNWWLVIHKQNPDGTMGEYVGQALVKPGINTNVIVTINLSLATPVLYAMLHEDHGVIRLLEFPGPDVPVMVNGQMLTPTFNVMGLAQDITINIRKVSDTVSFLTDGKGNSLYIYLRDTPGKSNCDAACQKIWKPLLATGRVIAGSGVVQAKVGVITLPGGTHQVTYLGAPLYYYSTDINPGDTNGQGVDGLWFLVTP